MIRIVVDFPAPFGPKKPVTRPGRGSEAHVVDSGEVAVPPGHPLDRDHGMLTGARALEPVGVRC